MSRQLKSQIFGKLKNHSENDHFFARMAHKESEIDVCFDYETENDMERLLPFGEQVWKARTKHFKAFREHAVSELLEDLNGLLDCGEEDPVQVTAPQLKRILTSPYSLVFRVNKVESFKGGKWCTTSDSLMFEMTGGEDPLLEDICISAKFDEHGEITDGEVVSLL